MRQTPNDQYLPTNQSQKSQITHPTNQRTVLERPSSQMSYLDHFLKESGSTTNTTHTTSSTIAINMVNFNWIFINQITLRRFQFRINPLHSLIDYFLIHQLPSSNSISQPFQGNLQNQSSTSSSSNNIHSQHYQSQSQTYANQQPTVWNHTAHFVEKSFDFIVSFFSRSFSHSKHNKNWLNRKLHSSMPTQIHLRSHKCCFIDLDIRWRAKKAILTRIPCIVCPAQRVI